MARGYWRWIVLLALVFLLPIGGSHRLVVVVWLGIVVAISLAAAKDFRTRGAPWWTWLAVALVTAALTPILGIILWLVLRSRWAAPEPA